MCVCETAGGVMTITPTAVTTTRLLFWRVCCFGFCCSLSVNLLMDDDSLAVFVLNDGDGFHCEEWMWLSLNTHESVLDSLKRISWI